MESQYCKRLHENDEEELFVHPLERGSYLINVKGDSNTCKKSTKPYTDSIKQTADV